MIAEPMAFRRGISDAPILRLNDVRVLLADSRAHIRNSLKVALSHAGLEKINQSGALAAVNEAIAHSLGPDILICDMGMDDGNACNLVTALRHNDLGRNPFLCVIGITWSPTAEKVAAVANSGVDHLIAGPIAPKQILDRISSMIFRRMPFVITADYIGPDRRKEMSRPSHVPLLQVPNSLRLKAMGEWKPYDFERQIAREVARLNTSKIDRQAENIMALADLIAAQTGAVGSAMIHQLIERLTTMVELMAHRASDHGFHHVTELCRACVEVSKTIRESSGPPDRTDIELVKHLGQAIRVALYPQERAVEYAHDIAETVTATR